MEKKPQSMSMDRSGPPRNPQRPYARPAGGTCGKIWSDLYGDMQRPAEMTGPSGGTLNFPRKGGELRANPGSNNMPKVAKSLVG